mmetsp:Transcript_102009/g.271446  ORF Transcript_102009/g.271446 Transcript_102009/m.271446 type:complete len:356 (-) Transcript_102009:17-1084(-)
MDALPLRCRCAHAGAKGRVRRAGRPSCEEGAAQVRNVVVVEDEAQARHGDAPDEQQRQRHLVASAGVQHGQADEARDERHEDHRRQCAVHNVHDAERADAQRCPHGSCNYEDLGRRRHGAAVDAQDAAVVVLDGRHHRVEHDRVDAGHRENKPHLRHGGCRPRGQTAQEVGLHAWAEEQVADARDPAEDEEENAEADGDNPVKLLRAPVLQLLVHGEDAHLDDHGLEHHVEHRKVAAQRGPQDAATLRERVVGGSAGVEHAEQAEEVQVHGDAQARRPLQQALAEEAQGEDEGGREPDEQQAVVEERAAHQRLRGVVHHDDVADEAEEEGDPNEDVGHDLQWRAEPARSVGEDAP